MVIGPPVKGEKAKALITSDRIKYMNKMKEAYSEVRASGTVYDCPMAVSYICQAFHAVIPATSDHSRILINTRNP